MANGNPVVPVMDWTEDAELHKRYVEWKEEVELELRSSLSNRANFVKSNYVLRWAGKPARDYLVVVFNIYHESEVFTHDIQTLILITFLIFKCFL